MSRTGNLSPARAYVLKPVTENVPSSSFAIMGDNVSSAVGVNSGSSSLKMSQFQSMPTLMISSRGFASSNVAFTMTLISPQTPLGSGSKAKIDASGGKSRTVNDD